MTKMVPVVRFNGFDDAWSFTKFGDVFKKENEKNQNQFPVGKTISIASMKFKIEGNGADSSSIANYKVLRLGDIAFEGHKNKKYSFGRFLVNDIGDGIMSPRFTMLKPINQLDINYWKQYIKYEPIMKHVLKKSTKLGTMMNELVIEDFLKQSINIPNKDEQSKIGSLFQKLDSQISCNKHN